MDTTIVYFTSLQALKAFGNTNDNGQSKIAQPLCIQISIKAKLLVSSERENIFYIQGKVKSIVEFTQIVRI